VAFLRALAPLRPTRAIVSTYESAAFGGREGMDALSEEVRSIFTMKDIESPHFGHRLAFNAIPSLGEDAFEADARLEKEIASGLEGAIDLTVSRVLVPAFSAEGAILEIFVEGVPSEAEVIEAIGPAKGLRFVREVAPSGASIDRDDALVARLRLRPGQIGAWIAADRLRVGSATPAVLFIEQWLKSLDA
jgi:aspartate-semialdehyde dehydrogenase